jgi:hypothetical protein
MGKLVLFSVAITMATIVGAYAQSRTALPASPPPAGASQTTVAPFVPQGPNQGPDQSHPLFSIGRLPVLVWTPVEQAYNSRMNRSAASNPLWEADGF